MQIFVVGSQRALQWQFLGIKYINERGELATTYSSTGSFSLISGLKYQTLGNEANYILGKFYYFKL